MYALNNKDSIIVGHRLPLDDQVDAIDENLRIIFAQYRCMVQSDRVWNTTMKKASLSEQEAIKSVTS